MQTAGSFIAKLCIGGKMPNITRLFFIILILSTVVLASGGGGFFWVYRQMKVEPAEKATETIRDRFSDYSNWEISNFQMVCAQFSGLAIVNKYLRLGGIMKIGRYDTGDPWSGPDEGQVGYGDFALAFMPEGYMQFGMFNVAAGLGLGMGLYITYIDDELDENDGEKEIYYFLNPEISGAFNLSKNFAIQLGFGYHAPFAGSDGVFERDPLFSYKVKPSETGGVYIRLGVFFGNLYDKKSYEKEYEDLKKELEKREQEKFE